MKKLLLLAIVIINVTLLNSCKKSDSTTTTVKTLPIDGIWSRTVGSFFYVLTFNTDYTYNVKKTGSTFETGTYALSGNTYIMTASGTTGCAIYTPSKYSYTVSSTALTFTLISDSCSGRAAIMPGTWGK